MSGLPELPPHDSLIAVRLRRVKLLLLFVGIADCLAIAVVFLPWTLIERLHSLAGMGDLPREPTVEYLVRSVSLLHALFGALLVLLARDVRRYLDLIDGLAVLLILTGVLLCPLDVLAGVPLLWMLAQSGGLTAIGVVLLLGTRSLRTLSGSTAE